MATYESQLQVALEAAREAGELLRREFHRPGGPRGHGSKADADEEAEWLIRRRLLSTFPDFGYRGEETGSAVSRNSHIWLVDPNDGTSSFLRGKRGSSVSIALLREGVPVLGVVFAYVAPDDRGDLIAWAEGADLTRNGVVVGRLPETARPERSVLLFSPHRPHLMGALISCIHPYRYRTTPSIAYRLALAASGEVAAAVSWHRPGDWDYAAGHALLRAAGGVFVNEMGMPITYASDGSSECRRCFGGMGEVVRDIQRRNWDEALHLPDPGDPVLSLPVCRLEPGHAVEDASLLSRAHGCLLGQVAGDALGQIVEFRDAQSIRELYPEGLRDLEDGGTWQTLAGQPTDDSEMAFMLARSIVRHGGYDPEPVAAAYRYWFHESAPFDYGTTTRAAIEPVSDKDVQAGVAARIMSQHARKDSQSNGSLMRISPLGVYGYRKTESELYGLAEKDSSLTHPHRVCCQCCALFVLAIADLIRNGSSPQETFENIVHFAKRKGVDPPVMSALQDACSAKPDFQTHIGWVLIAFQNAFYQLLHAGDFEEGIVDTVMSGGDTDTNAAIAGSLLGAAFGRDAIPPPWRQMILSCRPHSAAGARHPRPRPCWPVDVLDMAERLLLCGQDGL